MGLGTPRAGREVVQNTVSHLLSVIQAIAAVDFGGAVSEVSVGDPLFRNIRNLLQFRLVGPGKTVEGLLHLEICAAVPRPSWLAINGRRIDRQLGQGYSIGFSANGRGVAIEDPMKQVVKHFALLVRGRDSVLIDDDCNRIRQRLEWYRQILNRLQ
jgi:hypothetical protein